MKSKIVISLAIIFTFVQTFAQSTAFTYQGRLNNNGGAADGNYDLAFTLYATNVAGSVLAGPVTNSAVAVTNGLFTTLVDFGNVFNGTSNWLEIAVSTNAANNYSTLAPRQQLNPVPYAIVAGNVSGILASSNLPNVLGGSGNSVNASYGTIVGGYNNSIQFNAGYSFLGGGYDNSIETNASLSFIGDGQYNSIGTQAYYSFLGGGQLNSIQTNANYSFLGGGSDSSIGANAYYSFLGGGYQNSIGADANYSFIGGGSGNSIQSGANYSFVGGGQNNAIQPTADHSAIGGGQGNSIQTNAQYSFLGGGQNDSIQAYAAYSFIGSGVNNSIQPGASYSVIDSGYFNSIQQSASLSFIGDGQYNSIGTNAADSFVGGGQYNSIQTRAEYSFVGDGYQNSIGSDAEYSVIGGGFENFIGANATYSFLGGGEYNSTGTGATYSLLAGGYNNTILANASYATIPGGINNVATNFAFAAGYNAHAVNSGAFVWSDDSGVVTTSVANDSVTFRASGGYRFFTGTGSGGATLAANATSWTSLSDRNAKKNFEPVDTVAVLDKLAAIPIQQWNYKWEKNDDVPNIGPMAQDFKHAFYPGRDDKGISTLEFDGVELAAIQGLNQKLNAKDVEIQNLQKQNGALASQLAALAAEVKLLAERK